MPKSTDRTGPEDYVPESGAERRRFAGVGRRLSARWKSARLAGSIPARVQSSLDKPRGSLKPCPSHSSGRPRSGDLPRAAARTRRETHGRCVGKRVTVVFEPCTGDVAQLGEHLLCTQGVTGSSPVISTSTLTTEQVENRDSCRKSRRRSSRSHRRPALQRVKSGRR